MKHLTKRRIGFSGFRTLHMIDDPDGGGGGGSSNPAPADPAPSDPAPSDPPPADPSDPAPGANYFGTMPEDWRTQAVKGMGLEEGSDEYTKALKQFDRVSDMSVLAKNYISAQDKIRAGEISNGLPENPSDEQMADYREANGIPATPKDYQLKLDDGLVLGEADEGIMGGIYEIAHAANVPAEAVSAMTNAMLKGRQAAEQERISQDGVDTQTTEKILQDTWGGDYKVNVNMVAGLLNTLPETIKEGFQNMRLPDGKAAFNSPEIMVAMADWARKINPAATVVPNSANPVQTIDAELATLKAKMGTPEWSKDKAGQARYMALIDAKSNMAKS